MKKRRSPLSLLKPRILTLLVTSILLLPTSDVLANSQDAKLALHWNKTILNIAQKEDGFLTLKGLRTVAMMHIAMHDTLAATHRTFQPYAYSGANATNVSPEVAAAYAAYAIAVSQFPDHAILFKKMRDQYILGINPLLHDHSAQLGNQAAQVILNNRADDGWNSDAKYQWHPMAPGVYAEFQEHSGTPQGFVFGSGWAKARGFGLRNPSQFRVPPPPPINSQSYTDAFNEVKTVGRFQSMQRTPEQTHISLWWKDFVENSHNRLARDLIIKEALTLEQAVRLLALLNMSIFDAYVASFDNKFHYNHWRPYTAIRWATHDKNPNTKADLSWNNTHKHTYAFPSYPSAHGTACAAAMTALQTVFGPHYSFTMRTPHVDIAGPGSEKITMQPPQRHFQSFLDAADECGLSRVYLGIHFRYD